jgi:hypothetical protein
MNQLQHHIVLFMKENEKQICNVGESNALVIRTRKCTSSIKKSDVMSLLSNYMSEREAAERANAFYSERPTQFKEYVQLSKQ